MRAFELSQLIQDRGKTEKLYLEFLRVPELSMGIYQLPKGGVDPQSPHTEDEVYFVVSGVAKKVEHCFHSIEEDLTVLVFFAPAEYSLKEKSKTK
jgi:hypothetical protein